MDRYSELDGLLCLMNAKQYLVDMHVVSDSVVDATIILDKCIRETTSRIEELLKIGLTFECYDVDDMV